MTPTRIQGSSGIQASWPRESPRPSPSRSGASITTSVRPTPGCMGKSSWNSALPMRVIRANLADHPAVRAWRRLGGDRAEPESIQILKEVAHDRRCDLDPFPPEGTSRDSVLELSPNRSAVYRLVGVGPGGSPVGAKRGSERRRVGER